MNVGILYCVFILVFHISAEVEVPSLSCLVQFSVISPPLLFLFFSLSFFLT